MDFGLSEDQQLLYDTVRSFLAERVPIARVRELEERDSPNDREVWQGLAELGVAGILIPEKQGGSDLTLLDAALVSQALGHAATPSPFLSTSVMAVLALRELDAGSQADAWLGGIAGGELWFGVAATELFSRREGAGVSLDGEKLRGKAMLALDCVGADYVLVPVGEDRLAVIRADAPGLETHPLRTIDKSRSVAELVLDGTPTEALFDGAGAAIARMLDAGRAGLAADTLGACETMIEQSVAYSLERKQFDRAIGSFQAVKHMCAEMIAELEPARSLLWYAAYSFDAAPEEFPEMAAHIQAHSAEIGREIASVATQVHGGVGWTDEQNLHVWYKRIGVARHLLGGPELLRERVAQLQGLA
jgi:alkylation response protein AidB-like acyl-CoA dehydrogenase